MAHFAKVTNGIVTRVIVAEQDFIDNFIDTVPGQWIQTSYNTFGGVHYIRNEDGSIGDASADQTKALRYNFAAKGYNYDAEGDAFYAPQPYDSWTLDTTTYEWQPPVARPEDYNGINYFWNEETQTWDAVTE